MVKLIITERKSNKVRSDKTSLFIGFKYDPETVDKVKSLPLRFYTPETREWEIPIMDLPMLIEKFPTTPITINALKPISGEGILEVETVDESDIKFKTTPYQHQIEGVKYGLEHKKFLLTDQQGLGKTKQVIDIGVNSKHKTKKVLIVTGVADLKFNWLKEVSIHSDEKGHVLGSRVNRKGKLVDKGNKARIEDLQNIDNIDAYFLITNIDTLRNKEVQKLLKKLTSDGTINIAAIDEIHRGGGKNGQSQAGKGIHSIASDYKIAMTGTPLINTPLDLWNILSWIGTEKRTFYGFRQRYCRMGGFKNYEVIGYQNMEELRGRVDQVQLRRLKDEVLDLPEKIVTTRYVEMPAKQKQLYNTVKEQLRGEFEELVTAKNPLDMMLRLRQVTSNPLILTPDVTENAKLAELKAIIEEEAQNGHKTIIYSNWTSVTERIRDELAEYNPAYVVGETKFVMEEQEKFQNDDSCKVIIGTIAKLGTGFTLTAAENVIFYDRPYSYSWVEQAEDRAHRIGQVNRLNVISLVVKGSIDEVIEGLIETKRNIADALVDGKLEKLEKRKLVAEILDMEA